MSVAVLTKAIGVKYNATADLKTALPGGLHHNRAPEGKATTRPYATFEINEAPSTSSFGNRTASIAVRFIVNADTDEDAAGAMAEIEATFADQLLPMVGANNSECYHMHEPKPGPLPDGVNEAGADPWQYIVTYIYCVRYLTGV